MRAEEKMNRSNLLMMFIVGCVFVATCMLFKNSFADETGAKCHYAIGNFKLVSLYDGSIDFPFEHIIKDATNFDHPYFHAQQGASKQVPINVFLLDTGAQAILFDTGLAGMFRSKTGQLMQSMQQMGYGPDQITAILITHFHPDHISGLLQDGSKAFPHAKLYLAQAELDYWLRSDTAAEHASIRSFVQKVMALYDVHAFAPDEQLFDGVRALASSGHTPGHAGFLCQSGQQKLLVWGDIIHMPEIQFIHPGISFSDDTDHAQAITTRKRILQQAVQESWIIAGVHLDSPGVGTVQMTQDTAGEGSSYQWMPMNPVCS